MRAATPRGPCQLRLRAQNDFRRAASFEVRGCGAGAFRCEPVAALYFALPRADKPPPCFTESFSCRFTDKLHLHDLVFFPFIAVSSDRVRCCIYGRLRIPRPKHISTETSCGHTCQCGYSYCLLRCPHIQFTRGCESLLLVRTTENRISQEPFFFVTPKRFNGL